MGYRLRSGTYIPFSRTMSVEVLGTSNDTYQSLTFDIRDRLWSGLARIHTDGEEVLKRIQSWKQSNNDIAASRHELIFKQAIGIKAPHRGNSTKSSLASFSSQVLAAKDLHDLSTKFVQHLYGPRFTVYRGLRYELPYLLESLLGNPNQASHVAPQSVVSNYTPSLEGALFFSPLIVERHITPRDVVLATNNLFVFREDEMGQTGPESRNWITSQQYYSPNGELQINGDIEYPVSRGKLSVIVDGISSNQPFRSIPAAHFFKNFHQYDLEMHEAMWECVRIMTDVNYMMQGPTASTRLQRWANSYVAQSNTSASDSAVFTAVGNVT